MFLCNNVSILSQGFNKVDSWPLPTVLYPRRLTAAHKRYYFAADETDGNLKF